MVGVEDDLSVAKLGVGSPAAHRRHLPHRHRQHPHGAVLAVFSLPEIYHSDHSFTDWAGTGILS